MGKRIETDPTFIKNYEKPAKATSDQPPPEPGCGDSNEQCVNWANAGECDAASPYAPFCYSFFPLGALQPCLCLLNPLTWYHAVRVRRARAHAAERINIGLEPLNAHFRFGFKGQTALWVRGALPASF